MKRFFQFLATSALIVSMQGCSKDSSLEPNPDPKVQLRLTGEINQTTRVNDAGFQADDKVGVYVSTNGTLAESGNYFDNQEFTYANETGSGVLSTQIPIYWPTKDSKLSVFAYYPYSETVSSTSAYPFAVATDQNADGAFYNSDFLYAKASELAPTSEAVNLTFAHKLSRVNIELKVAEDSNITLDALKSIDKNFTILGVATEGTIDLEDGTATAGNATATITPMAGTDGVSYSAIVYPQQNKVTFRIALNERIYGYSTNVNFEAGNQYGYTLTINAWDQPELTASGVSVSPWTDSTSSTGVMSDFINIPDANFKAYLLQEKLYTDAWGNDAVEPTTMIDQNRDGQISIEEAEAVVYINLSKGDTFEEISAVPDEQKVQSLDGIEYFTNLIHLNCRGNLISTVDVSRNTKLQSLDLQSNQLTSLDVSKNTELTNLNVGSFWEPYNQLTSLDLSNNTQLHWVSCENNQITSLDFSNQPDLEGAAVSGNPLNGNINLSQNGEMLNLYVNDCGLTSIDVSHMTDLNIFCCADNDLTELDVTNNTKLIELETSNNSLAGVNLEKNSNLRNLRIRKSGITSLEGFSHLTSLQTFDCSENDFSGIDVVDFSVYTFLTYLQVDRAGVKAINVSSNTALQHLTFDNNTDITAVDLSTNTALEYLRCHNCSIAELDLSTNTNLKELYCNPMETLKTIYIPSAGYTFEVLEAPDGVTPTVKQ